MSLQIQSDTITASDHVRVLGVTFLCDLMLDKQVSIVCAQSFFGFANCGVYDGH